MIDEKALQAAIPVGSNMANADLVRAIIEAYEAARSAEPVGHVEIEHDGFKGDIIGYYTTREGKRGVVVQQDGTRVVHVYGEKWIK